MNFSWFRLDASIAVSPPHHHPYLFFKYNTIAARTVSIIFQEQRALIHRKTNSWNVHGARYSVRAFMLGVSGVYKTKTEDLRPKT